jgi:hypothetical protein
MTYEIGSVIYNADGSIHQPSAALGELVDQNELANAVASPAILLYHAGLFTFDRPNLATGYPIFTPIELGRLQVLYLTVAIGTPWEAAGAAALSIGTVAHPTWFTVPDLRGLSGQLPSGFGFMEVDQDEPLLVIVSGAPTAGNADIWMFVAPATFYAAYDPATQAYYG